jgi:ribokinase
VRVFVLGNYMNAHFLYVDRLPRDGESLTATRHAHEHGGKGLNLAVGLHRLGVTVDLLIAVGTDEAGSGVVARLAEEGIGTEGIMALGGTSGFGVGFIAPDGRNFLAVHPGANALLTTAHLDQAHDALAASDFILAQFESADALIRHAFVLARSLRVRTYLNPSPWRPIDAGMLALTDVLVVNANEAALLFEQPELEWMDPEDWVTRLPRLADRLGWRGEFLVVTLGENGSIGVQPDGQIARRPAYRIQQRDATGAGDAFGAGLVWSLLRGEATANALSVGNACGAIVAGKEGVWDALPDRDTLSAFTASPWPD